MMIDTNTIANGGSLHTLGVDSLPNWRVFLIALLSPTIVYMTQNALKSLISEIDLIKFEVITVGETKTIWF